MIKLTLLYGQPADPDSFERYYAETHLPIAARIKGVRRFELSKALAAPDAPLPALYRMAEFYFDDVQQMQGVLGTQEARDTVADLANFATGGVTMLVSAVESVAEA